MTTTQAPATHTTIVRQKPLMNMRQILLLGTVASEVVRRAECEVLIVRPRPEPPEPSPPGEATG